MVVFIYRYFLISLLTFALNLNSFGSCDFLRYSGSKRVKGIKIKFTLDFYSLQNGAYINRTYVDIPFIQDKRYTTYSTIDQDTHELSSSRRYKYESSFKNLVQIKSIKINQDEINRSEIKTFDKNKNYDPNSNTFHDKVHGQGFIRKIGPTFNLLTLFHYIRNLNESKSYDSFNLYAIDDKAQIDKKRSAPGGPEYYPAAYGRLKGDFIFENDDDNLNVVLSLDPKKDDPVVTDDDAIKSLEINFYNYQQNRPPNNLIIHASDIGEISVTLVKNETWNCDMNEIVVEKMLRGLVPWPYEL